MASPQIQKGYTRLANELAEAIYRFPFSGQELRLILWVLRNSFGWQRRDTAHTSVRDLAKATGIPPATVGWVVKGLTGRGVVLRMNVSGGFRLNKNYDEWLLRGKGQLPLVADTAAKRGAPSDAPKTPQQARHAKRSAAARQEFVKPTLADVQAYCRSRNSPVDPERFWHHYEATNWMSGHKPITNWKSSVCYWERSQYAATKPAAPTGPKCPLCEEHPLPNQNAIVCDTCGPRCRACNAQTARLRIVTRPDKTKTAVCADGCDKRPTALQRAAVPEATRKLEAERHERFMAAHRRKMAAKESK